MTAFDRAWESLTPDLETPVQGGAITFEPSMTSNDECCEEAKANFLYRLSQIWADGDSPVEFDLDDRFYTTYADKIEFNSPEWGQMTCENFRRTLEDLAADSIPDPEYGDVDWVREIGFADERDGWGGLPPTMGFPKAQAATRQLAKDILREWDACSNAQLDDMGAVDMDENAIDEQRVRDMDGASAFSKAWDVVKMPARDRRYTVTADDVKRMQELSEQGMSQAAIWKLFNSEGIPVSRGIVHYWVNEGSRMRQREKNAKRTYIPGSSEDTMRIQRDQEKRRENWEADPDMRLRHTIQSAKDETRSGRHTVEGMTMDEAEALMQSGKLKRPNAKIPEENE